MISMPGCIKATLDLMSIELFRLDHHNSFNIAAMSFSAGELAEAIRAHVPDFVCEFQPDHRQRIPDSWPHTIDDSDARREWNWKPQFDLHAMTADMLEKLRARGIGE